MLMHEVKSPKGSRQRRKIVGRGKGSGLGHTSGRGEKGQGARSGNNMPFLGFQGGQMRLIRALPKVGFNCTSATVYEVINICSLEEKFKANDVVDAKALKAASLLSSTRKAYKILSRGELSKALTVKGYAFSKSAQAKIEKAGGKVEVITAKSLAENVQ